MTFANKLRHRVDIEQYTSVIDSNFGGETQSWTVFADNVAAEILSVSGREFFAAQEQQNGVNYKITIRYKAGILPKMRVNHGGTIYNIKAVLPDSTGKRYITLMAELGVNNG
jgi:SPP1 family predicted phage head-tail adaptor